MLEWVAYAFSSGSSPPRNWIGVPCIAGGFFTNWTMRKGEKKGFPHSSVSKESTCNARHVCLIPWLGRSPGEGHDNLLQYSCLESPLDWEAWQATVHGVARVWHDLATKLPSEKKYVQGCHHDGLKGFYVNEKNKEKVAIFENQMQFF